MIGCVSLLSAMNKKKENSESIIKYFMVQSVGSIILVLAIAGSIFYWSYISFISVMLLGLCLKLGLFPVYMWLPGVIGGLSWIGCFFVSCFQKVAPFAILFDIYSDPMKRWLIFIGMSCAVIGGVGGLNQVQIRRVFAYSSIHHIGWVCCILCLSDVYA